jgi:hypothetical protein
MRPTATLNIRRNTSAETEGQPRPEGLSREAGRLLAACGVERSRAWVSRIVRDYLFSISTGYPFGAYLLNRVELNTEQRRTALANSELASFLNYADPTGETAVRNVMRGTR